MLRDRDFFLCSLERDRRLLSRSRSLSPVKSKTFSTRAPRIDAMPSRHFNVWHEAGSVHTCLGGLVLSHVG